jgi:choline-glycine betaine transporter
MPDMNNAMPALIALAASIYLLVRLKARLFPIVALVASGLEVLRSLAILNVKVPVIPAATLLAAAIVVGGVGSWLKTSSRIPVTAAALIAFVGAMRLLSRYT